MARTKKELASKAQKEEANRDIAKRLAEKHAKEDADRLKEVQLNMKLVADQLRTMRINLRCANNILGLRQRAAFVTSHPMFRSKAGYFNWQLSALNWIFQMAVDITMYLQEELFNMQQMINAIKEE